MSIKNINSSNEVLVYSTDPAHNKKCPRCKYLMPECRCPKESAKTPHHITAVLRIEKSGRKGKTVTVIDHLPKQEFYLKDLAKKIKIKCGSGGTYRLQEFGVIEIQGEHREIIRLFLNAEGIECKG